MLATPSSSSSSSSNTCAVKSARMHCRRAASSHCTRTDSLAAGSLSSSSRGRDRQRCDTPTALKSTALIDILLECIVKHKVRSNAKRSNTCASAMRTHRQPSHRPAPTGLAQLPAGRRAATQCGQRRSGPQWAGPSRSRSLPFPHPRLLPPSPHDSARVGATARCRHLPRHALQAEPSAPIASVIEERAARHLGAMARAARALLRLAVIRRAVEAQPARATRVDINCHGTYAIRLRLVPQFELLEIVG